MAESATSEADPLRASAVRQVVPAPISSASEPFDILVVGWFPTAGDPGAGRFIADQVAALRATGRVKPWVATFEGIPLFGEDRLREAAEAATERHLTRAVESGPSPFVPRGAAGPTGIPVARLGFAAGPTPGTGAEHGFLHRETILAALLRRPDRPAWALVHGHVGYPEGAAAARLAEELGVPFVLTEHATYLTRIFAEPRQRARYVETVRRAARVVTVTRMLADELIAELAPDVPDLADRLVVIPNAIAVETFPLVEPAQRAGAELLWVGYRKPVKGIDTLLHAFARVRQARPEARLRLIGTSVPPTDDAHWLRLAAKLGVADGVSIEGPADRPTVAAAMSRASLFVHPSNRETFGVVAAEALATGLPVVATDSGGVTEVLGPEPERLGALVPRGDPAALAAAILDTLDRRHSFDPRELRDYVETRYAASAVATKLVALYDGIRSLTPSTVRRRGTAVNALKPSPPVSAGIAHDRVIVVGFQRSLLDRYLERLPAQLLDELLVVSTGAEPGPRGRWVLAGPGTDRRLTALLARGWRPPPPKTATEAARHLLRRLGRGIQDLGEQIRTLRRGPTSEADVLTELQRTLAEALGEDPPLTHEAASGSRRRTLVVCLAGLDHLVVDAFIGPDVEVAGGGLAWLADRLTDVEQPPSSAGGREPRPEPEDDVGSPGDE